MWYMCLCSKSYKITYFSASAVIFLGNENAEVVKLITAFLWIID